MDDYYFNRDAFVQILKSAGVLEPLSVAVADGFKLSDIKIRSENIFTSGEGKKVPRVNFDSYVSLLKEAIRKKLVPLREIALVNPDTGYQVILQFSSIKKDEMSSAPTFRPMFQVQAHNGSYNISFPPAFSNVYFVVLKKILPGEYNFFLRPYSTEKESYNFPVGFAEHTHNIEYLDREKTKAKRVVEWKDSGIAKDVFSDIAKTLFLAAQQASLHKICPLYLNILLGRTKLSDIPQEIDTLKWWRENDYFYLSSLFLILTSFVELNHKRKTYKDRDAIILERLTKRINHYLKNPPIFLDALSFMVYNTVNVIVRESDSPENIGTLYQAIVNNQPELLEHLPLEDQEELKVLTDAVNQFHNFASRIFPYFEGLSRTSITLDKALFLGSGRSGR